MVFGVETRCVVCGEPLGGATYCPDCLLAVALGSAGLLAIVESARLNARLSTEGEDREAQRQ
jgi:hypothetical protein